ncbi:amidohydrolase family protein [Lacticaseibacillus baoqingensis]|uniref:Amidohydrolase family protein n=1 Tax=Lacticaseibacillus baoqingensis TaxID=2486013 RepID=A0ABW4E7R1_9LACO|nr:2-pyrone-4,6-dicarboxylate hydrolase [Lacticaseibacillus baoqingensis]
MQKIFDAHFHIIERPFSINARKVPPRKSYLVGRYLKECHSLPLDFVGGAVVSSAFHGDDQWYLMGILPQLGKRYVGITQIPNTFTDDEIMALDEMGIRGIRFDLSRVGKNSLTEIETLANRVYSLAKWSTEFYSPGSQVDPELETLILKLPKVSVYFPNTVCLSLIRLRQYLAHGVRLKVTGLSHAVNQKNQMKIVLPLLYRENPQGLMFGTELPETQADNCFSMADIYRIQEALSYDSEAVDNVLYRNAQKWYFKTI